MRLGGSNQEVGVFVPLTDTACRKALPGERDYKLSDAGGLYLFCQQEGRQSWRLKYRFCGKEKVLTFGTYPDVPLREAQR